MVRFFIPEIKLSFKLFFFLKFKFILKWHFTVLDTLKFFLLRKSTHSLWCIIKPLTYHIQRPKRRKLLASAFLVKKKVTSFLYVVHRLENQKLSKSKFLKFLILIVFNSFRFQVSVFFQAFPIREISTLISYSIQLFISPNLLFKTIFPYITNFTQKYKT